MRTNEGEIARRTGLSIEEVARQIEKAKASTKHVRRRISVLEGEGVRYLQVTRRGVGPLVTDRGMIYHFEFRVNDEWSKYSVLYAGALNEHYMPVLTQKAVTLRIDSGCETGQVFGDRTCDCREQLEFAIDIIQMLGEGIIINIPHQDGRGRGLAFKLATLTLQKNLQLDTIEAAELIAGDEPLDTRTYSGAIAILKFLGITTSFRISLASNSPQKLRSLNDNGYYVVGMTPVRMPPTPHTERHLRAKQEVFGHINLLPEE